METGKRMVLSQWSLADTRMCARFQSWWTIWIANSGWDIELRRRAKVVWCSAHSCWDPEEATWFLEALTEQHWQPRLFPAQGLRCLPSSSFLSFQHCKRPFAEMDAVMKGMVLFQRSLADTCMCALSSELVMAKYWLAVWTPHPLARLAKRHLTSASGKCLFFQHGEICYILCSFLLGIGKGNEIPGNKRILGSPWWIRNEGSSQHKVWRVCQTSAFPDFNIVNLKETLFIDLTLCKNGNSGENGSTCVPFQRYWYWWRTWTGFLHECPSVRSVSMAKVQCSATWFQVATGFLEALSQLHQQPGQAHPNTRSEVSTRLKLSPLHWSDLWQD